ncbi:MAG: glycosyltransferase, partial [Clostridia bacterium]|nr:glycosyltransferase [Clostridia bacterium]
KQERWMAEFGPQTGAVLAVGLGGALDVFAGVVERAPQSWQRLNLEWLYRLTKEPKRIGRMAKLPLFLVSALGAKLGGK